jgi:hypothetical protein
VQSTQETHLTSEFKLNFNIKEERKLKTRNKIKKKSYKAITSKNWLTHVTKENTVGEDLQAKLVPFQEGQTKMFPSDSEFNLL